MPTTTDLVNTRVRGLTSRADRLVNQPRRRRRRVVAQTAVKADRVVIHPPTLDQHLRHVQRVEDFRLRQLIGQLPVAARDVTVLPRAAPTPYKASLTPTRLSQSRTIGKVTLRGTRLMQPSLRSTQTVPQHPDRLTPLPRPQKFPPGTTRLPHKPWIGFQGAGHLFKPKYPLTTSDRQRFGVSKDRAVSSYLILSDRWELIAGIVRLRRSVRAGVRRGRGLRGFRRSWGSSASCDGGRRAWPADWRSTSESLPG